MFFIKFRNWLLVFKFVLNFYIYFLVYLVFFIDCLCCSKFFLVYVYLIVSELVSVNWVYFFVKIVNDRLKILYIFINFFYKYLV